MANINFSSLFNGSDWSIEQLPGLSKQQQTLLQAYGIKTTKQLLSLTNTTAAKQQLANQLHLSVQFVHKWAAMADVSRVPSVGCKYCGLILHAGIASVSQLAQTPLPRLHKQILRLQVATMQRRDLCPPVQEIKQWIEQAKVLN